MLAWKVHRALIKAHLEPYLGFLHSTQHGKPSLVCDVQELYRHRIDDFLIQYCQELRQKDFVVKTELLSRMKQGQRVYLNDARTRELLNALDGFLASYVNVSTSCTGNRQTIIALISEDVRKLAKHLKHEQVANLYKKRKAYSVHKY